ncbi:hypothetical protein [Shumkonia mesophila]|uniref:hypothetical protein n=1 Tax=Shumkonia mesophila TaxID=2838854 RepID=UPI0029351D9D|nr:hypothetical protein [Shumkonia mesophila]
MKYEVTVRDIHDEWFHGGLCGLPDEGPNPAAVFEKAIEWCRLHNVMPETISVTPAWKVEREG